MDLTTLKKVTDGVIIVIFFDVVGFFLSKFSNSTSVVIIGVSVCLNDFSFSFYLSLSLSPLSSQITRIDEIEKIKKKQKKTMEVH